MSARMIIAASTLAILLAAPASAADDSQAPKAPDGGTATIAFLKPLNGYGGLDDVTYDIHASPRCPGNRVDHSVKFSMAMPVFMRPKYVRERRYVDTAPAGRELFVHATTRGAGMVAVAGSIAVTSRGPSCENLVSFTPEAGRRYRLEQQVAGGACAIVLQDEATGETPGSFAKHDPDDKC